jgi:peroxiredoxin Q/BCP
MVNVGDEAPDFSAESTLGEPLTLSALRGQPVVLYFFPKAFTLLCTVETKQFRDNYDELRALGAEVIGISADKFDAQCRFARKHNLRFPLIGDGDICKRWGVLWPLLHLPRRITFIVDENGVVAARFAHEVQVSRHLDDVLRYLERRGRV